MYLFIALLQAEALAPQIPQLVLPGSFTDTLFKLGVAAGIGIWGLVRGLMWAEKFGLITSKRGIQGGYALARPPDQITLYDIMKAIDGNLIEFSGNYEGRTGRRMKEVWTDLRATLEAKARDRTLESLITKSGSEMYHI